MMTRNNVASRDNFNIQQQRRIWGWIFLSPWIIGFLVFGLIPIIASLAFSFTDYNLISDDPIQFIGFDNYERMFSEEIVWTSLIVTARYAAIALPLAVILPVLLATLMNSKYLAGKRVIRTLFYMPYMVPAVSAVYIWGGVLNAETGWINRSLALVGINGPNWLFDIAWIYPALNIIGLWSIGNAMLITLAGLQGVPTELYEAAEVDGAGPFTRFRKITLPMISPIIFYNLIISVIGLFRYFDIPYILKEGSGDPDNATMFYNINLYKEAFVFQDMGYGATLAWLLFAVAMLSTMAIFISARYWVYYSAEEVL